MIYPVLYIDKAVPKGWSRDYITIDVRNTEVARTVLNRYSDITGEFLLGLDFRNSSPFVVALFLKFIENTSLKLIIRAVEPVPPTVISRMGSVVKSSALEKINPIKLILSKGVIGQKISELK